MSAFADFAPLLRKRGFRKVWDSRAGGCRTAEWTKRIAERQLDVQIWEDGKHRATHSVRNRSTTLPTSFLDETSLDAAIARESTRRDNLNLAT